MSFRFRHWINWLSVVKVNMPLSILVRLWSLVFVCIYAYMSLTKKKHEREREQYKYITFDRFTSFTWSIIWIHCYNIIVNSISKFIRLALSVCKSIKTISLACLLHLISLPLWWYHQYRWPNTYNWIFLKKTSGFIIDRMYWDWRDDEAFRLYRKTL
jgi:cbb3-type cytochrome oxidase subunit 3